MITMLPAFLSPPPPPPASPPQQQQPNNIGNVRVLPPRKARQYAREDDDVYGGSDGDYNDDEEISERPVFKATPATETSVLADLRLTMLQVFMERSGVPATFAEGWDIEETSPSRNIDDDGSDGGGDDPTTNNASHPLLYLHGELDQSFTNPADIAPYLLTEVLENNLESTKSSAATTNRKSVQISSKKRGKANVSSPSHTGGGGGGGGGAPRPYSAKEDDILVEQRSKGHTFTTISNSFLRHRSAASLIGRWHAIQKLKSAEYKASHAQRNGGGGGGPSRRSERSRRTHNVIIDDDDLSLQENGIYRASFGDHSVSNRNRYAWYREDSDLEYYRGDDELMELVSGDESSDSPYEPWLNDEINVASRERQYYAFDNDEFSKRMRASSTSKRR